jgi:UDP-N-acetylglucosamine--N-acetylmuramyl-(pentapeptide) pyrophosphoryl-undecaprenol N-acetylglucosamine transferase
MSAMILLTAGGTGGHMFPAEALASELGRRGHRLALVTDRRGSAFGGALGCIERFHISGGALAGQGLTQKAVSVAHLAKGYWQAGRLIHRLRPDAVIGFGGYASVPALLAASHAHVPTALHEQNAVLGRANRLLAGSVSRIATSYDEVGRLSPRWAKKVRLTGMPVRPAILDRRQQSYPLLETDGPLSLLVVGGSQGAKIFSDLLPQALLRLPEDLRNRLTLAQQCRAEDLERVRQCYRAHGVTADLRSFFEDMPARLAAAHLVISRSGASTMAELAAIGRPAILVPYLYAIDDHQTANARAFDRQGAGWLTSQLDLTPDSLAIQLEALLRAPDSLREAAARARDCAVPDAAERLADLIVDLAEGRS